MEYTVYYCTLFDNEVMKTREESLKFTKNKGDTNSMQASDFSSPLCVYHDYFQTINFKFLSDNWPFPLKREESG